MLFQKLKIKNCFILMLVIIFIVILYSGVSKEAHAEEQQEMQRIVVRSGDTLWNLVESYYNFEGDIRYAIHEIKQINNLSSSELFPGQIIYIPYFH